MSEDRPGRDGKSPSWLEGGFHLGDKGQRGENHGSDLRPGRVSECMLGSLDSTS